MTGIRLSARALVAMLGDWRATSPAYQGLADRIRLLLLDGRVGGTTRLPAERELASALEVSRTTVAAAYAALRETGHLRSVQGSGSVTVLPAAARLASVRGTATSLDLTKAAWPAPPILGELALLAAGDLTAHLGSSGYDPVGLPDLREAIAGRYRSRGLPTTPDQVMVTIGAQHALGLLARTLLTRGDRALVELPTYPHAYEAFRGAGARLVPVPVSAATGWDLAGLQQAIARTNPTLGYLIPDFQNPTGQSMPAQARELVVAAAARHGTVLVADETTAELDIDRAESMLPLAAYGPEGTVVSVGSLAKTVWGGLRVGWIRADAGLVRRLVAARAGHDLGTPILEQLVATRALAMLDDLLASQRPARREGRDALMRALADHLPQWVVPRVHGGLAVWAHLGAPVSSSLTLAARGQGLVLAAGPRFGLDGAFERFLRIPLTLDPAQAVHVVEALAAAWDQLPLDPAVDNGGYLAAVV